MYLKQLTISNYKSFYEPKTLNFEPGLNVLLGANSSGKTSVLEAILFHQLTNTPHRTILNVRDSETLLNDASTSELQFSLDLIELQKLVSPNQDFYVGVGDLTGNYYTQDLDQLRKRLTTENLMLEFRVNQATGQYSRIGFNSWPSIWRQLGANSPLPSLLIQTATGQISAVNNQYANGGDISQL